MPEFLFNLAVLAAVAAAAWLFPRATVTILAPSLLLTLVLMACERLAGRS